MGDLQRATPMDATRWRNILVPGWILTFGLVVASAPPLGVLESVAVYSVGLFVVPALILFNPLLSASRRQTAETRREGN